MGPVIDEQYAVVHDADDAVHSCSMESATFASRKGRRPAKRKVSVCQKEKENTSPAVDPPVKQRKKYSRSGWRLRTIT